MSLIRSFIFNRGVLGLLIAACFAVTLLNLYFDNSQIKIVNFSALTIAQNNADIINQGGAIRNVESANSFNDKLREIGSPLSVHIFNANTAKDSFQKNAVESLSKNPQPFYSIDFVEKQSILRYAIINAAISGDTKSYLEIDVPMGDLENLADRESIITLWVLVILALLSTVFLAIFVGYLRHSAAVLSNVQEKALNEQKKLTYAYGRFFPPQFLTLLGKKSILDIKLGDQVEKKMAVLFADIRNFTTLIETTSPAESFRLINNYLAEVGPIVRKYNGFIDKYIGDAIMALFEKPDEALLATIEIMELLEKTVAKAPNRSKVISEIVAGIHFGHLMVGTVGEVERMDGTVISDAVNSASRLEALNRSYGTHILISEEFLNSLTAKERFKIRPIDHIYAKGKSNGMKIYEVFNLDPPELIQKKDQIKNDFEKAMQSYEKADFAEAIKLLKDCQKILPQDPVLKIFIARSERYLAEGIPDKWTPIARLLSKDEVN